MCLLGIEHLPHFVRLRPHALADLRPARQATGDPDIDVAIFVRENPRLRLDRILSKNRACLHAGVNLVARTVEEARIDEHDALAHSANTLGEIDRCAALFVHDADLERIGFKPEQFFDATEQCVGKRDFVADHAFSA